MKSLYICLIVSFWGCDKFTDVQYYGSNKSNKTLLVKMFTNNNADSIVFELLPNEADKQMSTRFAASKGTKNFNCCPCFYENIKVEVKDLTKNVTKNPNAKENWTFKIKKGKFTKSSDKIECFFEIEQSDLQ